MKSTSTLFALVVATLATASAHARTEVIKVKDKSLVASFSDSMSNPLCPSGPYNSSVDLQWNTSSIRQDGALTTGQAIVVSVHYVNGCTGDDLIMSGFALDATASFSGDLLRAHLVAMVPVSTDPELGDVKTASISLSLDFTATGPVTKIKDTSQSRDAGVLTINSFSVASRTAVATGTITSTLPLLAGPTAVSLTSVPSLSAQIGSDGFGAITVVYKNQ